MIAATVLMHWPRIDQHSCSTPGPIIGSVTYPGGMEIPPGYVNPVLRGTFTCVGWQVTPCEQVTPCGSEMGFPLSAIYLRL